VRYVACVECFLLDKAGTHVLRVLPHLHGPVMIRVVHTALRILVGSHSKQIGKIK